MAITALVAVVALGGFLATTAAAGPSCTDTYTNAVTTGDWSTAANWSTGKVPTSSDVACWSSNQTLTVSSSADTADSIQGGALTISSGDLFLASSTNDSSVTALTINGGAMNGGGRTLSVAGDFDWNVPNGASSSLGGGSTLNISQTGSHSFKIEGTGLESMSRGAFSTPNPVSITNTNFSPNNFPGPTLTTTSTITFAAGTYSGNFTMTTAGIVTPTGAVSTQYSLDLTGNSSDVKGDLTLAGFSSDAGTTLSIPSGHVLAAGGGTIAGTVDGAGTFDQNGAATTVTSGASLTAGAFTATLGQLTIDSGATYSTDSTTIQGGGLVVDDSGALTKGLTITAGALDGVSGAKLSVAGDFDWNVPAGSSSSIGFGGPLAISQTGSHTFQFRGAGSESVRFGLLSTPNPVSITNTKLAMTQDAAGSLKTDSTITFATGTYGGAEFPMTAVGIVTTGAVSSPFSLDLTGDASSLGGDLTLTKLSTETVGQLHIPAGDTVSAGGGTIAGTVDGAGTFDQNGAATTVTSGGSLATGAFTASAGQLTIDSGAGYSTGSTTVSTSNGATPGRLEIDDNNASTGPLTITGGSFNGPRLNGSGKLSVAGDFDWSVPGGGVSGINDTSPNSLTVAQKGAHTFKIEGSGSAFIGGGLLTTPNDVSISDPKLSPEGFPGGALTSAGVVSFTPGTYGGGNFAITANGVKTTGGAVSTPYSLDLTGSSSSLGGDLGLAALSVEAGQTLTIPAGDTVSAGGGTISGTVNGAGTFDQHGSTSTLASGGTLSPGAVTATAGQLVVNSGGDYSPGSTAISSPDPATPATLEIDDNNATTGPLTITGNSFNGPRLNGSGKLTVAGDFDWNSPSGGPSHLNDSSPNSLTVAQTGAHTFKIEGSGTAVLGGGTLTTPNPVTISNPNFTPGGFGSSLTTTSTATFTNAGSHPGGNLTLTAAGVNLAAGDTTLPYTLDLTGGNTSIPNANNLTASQVNESGGTLQVDGSLTSPVSLSGGTLKGTGTVSGPVDNSGGTVAPGDSPGTLTVTGDYTQDAGGTLAEEITGTTPGTQFDQLVVNGALTLDGTLAIDWHTFVPADTDTFKIITGASSRTGNFATVTGATVGGKTFQALGDPDGVTLAIQPPPAPSNTGLPVISGTTAQGQTLHTTNGSWDNNPTSFDYQWEDCDSSGANCVSTGTDSSAYTLTGSDVGHTIRVVVTAHNAGGSGQATSDKTATVLPLAPSNTGLPVISGTTAQGQTLHTTNGSWDNNPTSFDYQWEDCDNAGANCVSTGTDSSAYTLNGTDVGHTIRVIVTAHNLGGSGQATADHTAVVLPLAPANTGLPVISGTTTRGQTLHTTNGSWDNNPSSFHYQWEDCDGAGANCTNTGSDSSSYTLTGSDVGHTVSVVVTAINAGGQGQAKASHTSPVAAPAPPDTAPTNTSPSTISGTPAPGQTLACGNGTWSPAPTSFTYQWSRDGSAISGATGNTYVVTANDRGHSLTCTVTAFNGSAASASATSAGVSVPAPAPVNVSPPTITGTPLPGNTLTCHPGTWTGNPTTFDYQWNRDTTQIPGATQQQYQVQIADEGHGLGCDVGADNGSAASSATASKPVIVAMKGTLNCPKPSGQINGLSVGPLALGMKRARARGILHRFAVTRNHFDDFCLFGGWGIRVAYPPSRLLTPLGRARGRRLAGKIVIALTANPFYALDGVAPGASLQLARSKLRLGKVFRIGLNDWYVAQRAGAANGVLKVRGGIVQEVGLVNKQLTGTRRAQSRLLIGFR